MTNSGIFASLRHIEKSYALGWGRRARVLEDVSCTLQRGCVTGLLGTSGSGKSTLARLLLGLEKPDGGAILLDGQDLGSWRAAHRGRMSVVFQNYVTSVNPTYTVADCLAEGLEAGGSVGSWSAMAPLLDRVGLARSLKDRRCLELSGGQIQRVCLARALAAKPAFLVLDEALSSLDVSLQAGIAQLLREEFGDMTCLFITHDIQLASLVCSRLLVLDRGRITDDVATEDLFMDKARQEERFSPRLRELLNCTIVFRTDFSGPEDEKLENERQEDAQASTRPVA